MGIRGLLPARHRGMNGARVAQQHFMTQLTHPVPVIVHCNLTQHRPGLTISGIIGRVQLPNILFFGPADAKDISNPSDFDGLLPLRLFQRVFICHAENFAILEPR